jgi:hypothetical protein
MLLDAIAIDIRAIPGPTIPQHIAVALAHDGGVLSRDVVALARQVGVAPTTDGKDGLVEDNRATTGDVVDSELGA